MEDRWEESRMIWERFPYLDNRVLRQRSKPDQTELKVKDQVYWAKHSWVTFQPPEMRQGKGAGEKSHHRSKGGALNTL